MLFLSWSLKKNKSLKHGAKGTTVLWKINTLWAVRFCLCVTHTHTHTRILLMTNLVQICPRLDTEKELFSARKHSKYTKILSFKSAFEHFKYRVVQLRPHTWSREEENPRGLVIHQADVSRRGEFQGGLGSGPWVLEWVQEVSDAIPGNSQLGVLVLPIPQKAARGS